MRKFTGFSLVCILLCARIFATLTFFPNHMESGLAYGIGAVISTLLQGILLIPAARLAQLCPEGPCKAAMDKHRTLGTAITVCFMLYFMYEAFVDAGSMAYFTDYFFSVNMHRALTALCCTLAAVYLARLDTAVIGRTAQIAFFGMVGLILMMTLCSAASLDIMRLDLAVERPFEVIGRAVISETERCECLVLFTFLAGRSQSSPQKSARHFLIAKGTLVGGLFILVTAALGAFGMRTKLPVFALASFSKNLITERSDAVFLLVWVFMGIVKLGVLIHCAAECLRLLFPSLDKMKSSLFCGVLPAFCALPLLLSYKWERFIYSEHSLVSVVGMSVIIPLILLSRPAAASHSKAAA